MRKPLLCCLLIMAAGLTFQPAMAVIVGGTSGTGNNNSTQAGLDSYLTTTAYAAFPYWSNLVRVSDASGIYLGYNASTMRGWILSANHVTTPSSIIVDGNPYAVTNGIQIGSSDLKLYEIGGVLGPSFTSLPTIPLPSVAASAGEFLLMFGRGFTTGSSAPYPWGVPGTDDANGMRWATNTVELTATVNIGTALVPNDQPYVVTDFDGPTDMGVTAYDGQASLGDSGGGMFIYRGGLWQLSGIAHFVDDGPSFLVPPDGIVNPAQTGNFSAYTDVKTYVSSIQSFTGTLVPEPLTVSFAGPAMLMAFRRRRH